MNLLDALRLWSESNQELMSRVGVLLDSGASPSDGRSKASRWINLRGTGTEVNLVVWDTGEAELGTVGPDGVLSQEHLELASAEELNVQLARLKALVAPPEPESDQT